LERTPQAAIHRQGAAIECRVYAENPLKNFLPSPGLLERFVLPSGIDGLRVDTGVRQGDSISPFYDPMIAKIITAASTRAQALQRMNAALQSIDIAGIRHNTPFLQQVIRHPAFQAGTVDTNFVDREKQALLANLSELAGDGGSPKATS
jgi:acetyl/propionyl-CoA carboxylase alpha subunit